MGHERRWLCLFLANIDASMYVLALGAPHVAAAVGVLYVLVPLLLCPCGLRRPRVGPAALAALTATAGAGLLAVTLGLTAPGPAGLLARLGYLAAVAPSFVVARSFTASCVRGDSPCALCPGDGEGYPG